MKTDEECYRSFLKERSEDDLRILFERYRENLILFLMAYVHNVEDAEELMMDAFAVVASGTAAFSGKSSFKTWLFSIARNQAGSFLRKRRFSFVEPDDLPAESTPELSILREEEKRQLYKAMESLPEKYRHVLFLIYFEQMSREEACQVMHVTKKQLYNLTERGRSALREVLERMGFDDARFR